jgi:S-DNA-T family DNA segregation ATPase FtsK/SpoIIIE
MAEPKNKKRHEEKEPPRWSNEVVGIILILTGLLLFLSLLSYSPKDLPLGWLGKDFAAAPERTGPRLNLFGPAGTLLGLAQMVWFGAAGYLLAVALMWCGVMKLLWDQKLWPRPLLGMAVLVLSGAALLHVIEVVFSGWTGAFRIHGPGGWFGYALSEYVFFMLGKAGAGAVLGCIYLISLVVLTGQAPLGFSKGCWALLVGAAQSWKERSARQTQAGEAKRRASERVPRRRPAAEAKSAVAPAAAEDGQGVLALKEVPAPQIIDASQRRSDRPEPGARPFERRKQQEHQSLSTNAYRDYDLPGFDLLDEEEELPDAPGANRDELLATQRMIIETLRAFGIEVTPGDITRGPTITRYEIYPSTGLRVSRISQLEADIARATKAERINILAPIPGKDTVGIEIANNDKVSVPLRELLQDPEFRSAKKRIPLALGKDVYGKTVIGDLAAMPHLLVAGATGSGKSVCINSIIASILFKFSPDELRFIMVDPKVVEMQMYSKLPHLVVPVVTDPKKVVAALRWTVNEMERRYRIFAKVGVRNFDSFNARVRPASAAVAEEEDVAEEDEPPVDDAHLDDIAAALASGDLGPEAENEDEELEIDEVPDRFPYIVVIIDELADLMQTAPADIEMCIARIAQKARAAGIHLIVATQTPRADVVTGIIKANIPCRIAFQVSSALDSRVILDSKGAEKLVGKGDMLYLPPGSAKLERSQGAFVSDEEVERLVAHCSRNGRQSFESDIQRSIDAGDVGDNGDDVSDADEEILQRCIEVIMQEGKASTSLLQRRLRLGYTRAARMIDVLEQRGIIGPGDGAKPREIIGGGAHT